MMALLIQTFKFASCGLSPRLYKVSKAHNVFQVAFITGKAKRTDRPLRPPPFPYHKKNYTLWDQITDPVLARFDDNTRILTIEGPIAAGKTKFAQQLAHELEMFYVPSLDFTDVYRRQDNEFDLRSLNDRLPEHLQHLDTEQYLNNPHHKNTPFFQLTYYSIRLLNYIWAVVHMLSTGQGVILNRSIYTDIVFLKAMHNAGYVSDLVVDYYKDVVKETQFFTKRPHLMIYLDVPVDVIQQRIKQRNILYEVNSKVLTKKYLTDIETIYKKEVLPELANHSQILFYDWTNEGDVADVVYDIEQLDVDTKSEDWTFPISENVRWMRRLYHNDPVKILNRSYISRHDVPEMMITAEDDKIIQNLEKQTPALQYTEGWHPTYDKSVYWRIVQESYFARFEKYLSQSILADETIKAQKLEK